MKRDIELVREILLWATSQEVASVNRNPDIPGYTETQIAHHVYLMKQASLVEAAELNAMGVDGPIAILLRPTWAGHDFVDAARNKTVWGMAKTKVLSSGASFTFDILKDVLSVAARGALGM